MNVLVTGARGGLGSAVIDQLLARPATTTVVALSRTPDALRARFRDERVHVFDADLGPDGHWDTAALRAALPTLDAFVHCAGVLTDDDAGVAPEKRLEQLDSAALAHSVHVHAFSPLLLLRDLFAHLVAAPDPRVLMVSARVGSIDDNHLGGWYGYRASKAALNQLTRTLAIECRRRKPSAAVIAYHPGTIDTALSRPYRRADRKGVLSPDDAARHLLARLFALTPDDSGRFYAWDGAEIAW